MRQARVGSVSCAAAMVLKSITGIGSSVSRAFSTMRERASAAGLLAPCTCQILLVNCEMSSR